MSIRRHSFCLQKLNTFRLMSHGGELTRGLNEDRYENNIILSGPSYMNKWG